MDLCLNPFLFPCREHPGKGEILQPQTIVARAFEIMKLKLENVFRDIKGTKVMEDFRHKDMFRSPVHVIEKTGFFPTQSREPDLMHTCQKRVFSGRHQSGVGHRTQMPIRWSSFEKVALGHHCGGFYRVQHHLFRYG
jgi:hypothetical protein